MSWGCQALASGTNEFFFRLGKNATAVLHRGWKRFAMCCVLPSVRASSRAMPRGAPLLSASQSRDEAVVAGRPPLHPKLLSELDHRLRMLFIAAVSRSDDYPDDG